MIRRIAISRSQPFPVILKYTEIRSYIFTTVFVLLNVAVPYHPVIGALPNCLDRFG
jgi:hypothetical protein